MLHLLLHLAFGVVFHFNLSHVGLLCLLGFHLGDSDLLQEKLASLFISSFRLQNQVSLVSLKGVLLLVASSLEDLDSSLLHIVLSSSCKFFSAVDFSL